MTIEYLEAVASIRCYFYEVAKKIYSILGENHWVLNDLEQELIEKVKLLCTNQIVNNSSFVGPGVYLIRLFARKYGFSSLIKLSKIFKWIIPEELLCPEQVSQLN